MSLSGQYVRLATEGEDDLLGVVSATTQPCSPVEVMIPVHVPCVATMPQKPAFAIDDIPDNASDFDKIQALAIDYLQQKQYINSLEAVVEGCL